MNREPVRYWNGYKLRNWREDRMLSLEQAGELLGVSRATLSRYERGHPPPLDMANRICAMTRGAIRYRDLYHSFHPEYA